MKLTLTFLLAFALTSHAQESDPAAYFPDDSTVVTGIRNLSKLYDLEDDHPIKELGRHPAVKHIFGEVSEGMSSLLDEELLTDIGMTEEELARAFPGRLALGGRLDLAAKADIRAAEEEAEKGGSVQFGLNAVSPDFAIIADCTLTEDQIAEMIEGFLAHTDRNATEADPDAPETESSLVRERADGLTLFRIERKIGGVRADISPLVTLAEGVLIFGFSEKNSNKGLGDGYFADVVRRVGSGGTEKDSIASTDDYLDAAEKLKGTDFYFYAPLEKLAASLEKMIGESYEQAEKDGNPVGMLATKDGLLDTIGLGDFKAFTIAGTLVPDGFELFNELIFKERRGIIAKLLRYDDGGISLPDFAPEGITGVAVSSMDFGGMLTEMLGAVKAISPMASGMLDMQLANLEKEGLSVRDGLIGSLGTGMVSFAGYSTDEIPEDLLPSHLMVINLSDPAGMERALAGLRGFVGKMGAGDADKREFMGETIYRMDEMAQFLSAMVDLDEDASVSYAIIGNHLVIAAGEKDFMEHGIASMKKKGAALDEDPVIDEAWRRWGDKDLVEFTYDDVATLLKSLAISTSASIDFAGEAGTDIDDTAKDIQDAAEALPPLDDLHYYLSAKTYNTPEALTGWLILAKKPK